MSSEAATTEEPTSLNSNENAVIINNTTDSPQQIPNNLCSGIISGFIPDEKDCDKYYNCLYGIAQVLQCTNGTEFDPITKVWNSVFLISTIILIWCLSVLFCDFRYVRIFRIMVVQLLRPEWRSDYLEVIRLFV